MSQSPPYDLLIVGGGINGAGIACDAAGRGLKVLLVEAGDLAGATSSASSKLIHGGLRYLEHYEFRLVREALAEREVLLAKAPHIIRPLRFILPIARTNRPRWLLRAGLFLYDHLYQRHAIAGSRGLDLRRNAAGKPLREGIKDGFAYWDCWVDDARLVVLNARAAAQRGAEIRTRTRFEGARASDGVWQAVLRNDGSSMDVRARMLVNAAGPWAARVQGLIKTVDCAQDAARALRLVKGSHVVLPRIAGADDAYILQHDDGRVVFVLPYEERFSLIGTTDVPFAGDPAQVRISPDEIDYLLAAVGRFFRRPLKPSDVVWTYAGVRPLLDDGTDDPSAVTRDYTLEFVNGESCPPLLAVYGGKITTYRRLAEKAMQMLAPHLPGAGQAWTASSPLPGGDMQSFETFLTELVRRRPRFDAKFLERIARRHGSLTDDVLGDAKDTQGLGRHIGASLFEREVAYLKANEWARTPEDILWRRTKVGLHLTQAERKGAEETIGSLL